MKTFSALVASAATLLLPLLASAQGADELCRVAELKPPAMAWRGQAAYLAKATVKGGRVVGLEIRALTAGVERQAQRILVTTISRAAHKAQCRPGDYVFERRFDFDLREAQTAEALADAEPHPVPVLDLAPLGNEVCRIEEPELPVLAGRGQAAYLAGVEIHDGRVLRSEVRVLTPGAVKNDEQRALLNAIREAMSAAKCPPGRHIVHKRFVLDLRAAAPTVWTP